jgi:hypothetical protein
MAGLERKLRDTGRTAPAAVLEVEMGVRSSSGWSASAQRRNQRTHCKVRLRVEPEGEALFEAQVSAKIREPYLENETVEVRYDPADHGKIVMPIDEDGQPTVVDRSASAASSGGGDVELDAEKAKILRDQ